MLQWCALMEENSPTTLEKIQDAAIVEFSIIWHPSWKTNSFLLNIERFLYEVFTGKNKTERRNCLSSLIQFILAIVSKSIKHAPMKASNGVSSPRRITRCAITVWTGRLDGRQPRKSTLHVCQKCLPKSGAFCVLMGRSGSTSPTPMPGKAIRAAMSQRPGQLGCGSQLQG